MKKKNKLLCVLSLALLFISSCQDEEAIQPSPSSTTKPKISVVPASPKPSPSPTPQVNEWTYEKLETLVTQNSPLYFEKDSSTLLPGEEKKLENILEAARHYKNIMLHFAGHTANARTWNGQILLSKVRAEKVRWWFENRLGDDLIAVEVFGFASRYLVDSGKEESSKAKNRRVVITLEGADAR